MEENKPTQINNNNLVNKDIKYDISQQINLNDYTTNYFSTENKNLMDNKLTEQNNDNSNNDSDN